MSLNPRLPDDAPLAVGVNVTATVQVAWAATGVEVEQVVPVAEIAKGPVAAKALKVRLVFPVLVSVTVWELLVTPTEVAEKAGKDDKLTSGPLPLPLKLTVCGLLPASSVSVRLPERAPSAVGVNVTLMTQLEPPAATGVLVLQVVPLAARAKSPVNAMLVKIREAVPLFVTVTALGTLVVCSA